jgi:segregation and condensation protein B|tara:strand:- start:873 stop:1619 length:747 start_codon:yes stop_codon:yes gene_type:complete
MPADESSTRSGRNEEPSLKQLSDAFSEMLKTDSGQEAIDHHEDLANGHQVPSQDSGADQGEKDDDPATAVMEERDPVTPKCILEAMLFVGHPENEPLTAKQAAAVIHGVQPREIEMMIEQLCKEYSSQGCIYNIRSEGSGYRMVLHEQYESMRDRFYGRIREAKLSQAAIEVLALVAYNQPTTSEKINNLRGHPSGAILSQLVRRQLLCMERPQQKPRTPTYRTTGRFLELFGLANLEELPKSEDLDS